MAKTKVTDQKTAEHMRRFNREYLSLMDLYNSRYLGTSHSITEARILFEIQAADEPVYARDLATKIRLDKGYLSRLLTRFERDGVIEREASSEDSRQKSIRLTEDGKALTRRLIDASNERMRRLLEGTEEADREELCRAMDTIITILKGLE